ncbi:hypothetical protein E2C01_041709 [Portunus trituberculatus]|uniref:Retrotransposon gag domain-containing protein n=1 Tax=Portunus trituberculatus TaxID=210409 RepID=A0A5B7FSK7_PORTR|nr:hypothetical protein [Portunus trituberculatus]
MTGAATPRGHVPHPLLPCPPYSTPRRGVPQHALRSSYSYPATCPTCTLHSSHNYPAACPTSIRISLAPIQTPIWARYSNSRHGQSAWRTTASSVDAPSSPVAVSYVHLLCDRNLQQRIDARYDKQEFRQLPTAAAINAVRCVVIGQRYEVGAWSDLFSYFQEPGDSVDAYASRCRALAAECDFRCPDCDNSLTEYVFSRKVIMGLSNVSMKAEVLRCFPRLVSVSDVVNQLEIIETVDRVVGRQATARLAALTETLQGLRGRLLRQ